MTKDRQKLVEENIKLTYVVAHSFWNSGIEFDDLVGICSIGLVKAADSYDLTKGIKFSSYCMRVMTNEVLQEIRKKTSRWTMLCKLR